MEKDMRVGVVKSETAGSLDDSGRPINALLMAMEEDRGREGWWMVDGGWWMMDGGEWMGRRVDGSGVPERFLKRDANSRH